MTCTALILIGHRFKRFVTLRTVVLTLQFEQPINTKIFWGLFPFGCNIIQFFFSYNKIFSYLLSTITEPVQNFPNNQNIFFHMTLIMHSIFQETFDNIFSINILCTSTANEHSLFKRIHFSHTLCTQFTIQHMPQCPSHLPALIQGTTWTGSLTQADTFSYAQEHWGILCFTMGKAFQISYYIPSHYSRQSNKQCKV